MAVFVATQRLFVNVNIKTKSLDTAPLCAIVPHLEPAGKTLLALTAQYTVHLRMLPQIGLAVIFLALAGTFFDLGIRLVSALFGDYIYKKHTINSIKKINEESTDRLVDYRKKGGTNLLLFLLGTFIVQYGYAFVTFFLR